MDFLTTVLQFLSNLGDGVDAGVINLLGVGFTLVIMVVVTRLAHYATRNERYKGLVSLWNLVDDALYSAIVFVAFSKTIEDMPDEFLDEADQLDVDWRMLYVIRRVEAQFPELNLDFIEWYERAERVFREIQSDPSEPEV